MELSKIYFIFRILLLSASSFELTGCTFSEWNTWSACSALCGSGKQSRERILKKTDGSCYSSIVEERMCEVDCIAYKNLALYKPVTTSSTFLKPYAPSKVTDGKTGNELLEGFCMHTEKDQNPWLRIDLGEKSLVDKVIVYNRGDCCTDRLNNIVIYVGNDINGTGARICGRRENMTDVLVAHMSCNERIEGQYIHLKIPGPQFLHVCEVEAMGYKRRNLALGRSRRVYQSSTEIRNRQWVNAAIDCVDNSNRKFCRTLQESNPWWRADLGYEALVEKVEFDLFPKYYKNNTKILVQVGNDVGNKNNKICGQTGDLSLFSELSIEIKCPPHTKGQHVYVQFLAWVPIKLTAYEIRIIGY